jgi:putative transposase
VGYFKFLYGCTLSFWVCSNDPAECVWSSFRCNAWGIKDDLVTPHSLYMELGATEARRRSAYVGLFEEALSEETLTVIRHAANTGWALGGEEFCERLGLRARRPTAPRKAGRPRRGDRTERGRPAGNSADKLIGV